MTRTGIKARSFLRRHPFDKNVFLMMRFGTGANLASIETVIRNTLRLYGLTVHMARDADLAETLWANVQTYLECCRYGIAVFEDIDRREFNPNISLELGYMLGKRKPCLLLKEQRMPRLPTDIVGHLYKTFDIFDIERTISHCLV